MRKYSLAVLQTLLFALFATLFLVLYQNFLAQESLTHTISYLIIIGFGISQFYKRIIPYLNHGHTFIISAILFAIAVLIESSLIQGKTREFYSDNYGNITAYIIDFLYLNNVYGSYWFWANIFILQMSLIFSLIRSIKRRDIWQYYTIYLGCTLIILGICLNNFIGSQGVVQIQKDKMSNKKSILVKNSRAIKSTGLFNFYISLDSVQKHPDKYPLQSMEKSNDVLTLEDNNEAIANYNLLISFYSDAKKNENYRIVSDTLNLYNKINFNDYTFRIDKFSPDIPNQASLFFIVKPGKYMLTCGVFLLLMGCVLVFFKYTRK